MSQINNHVDLADSAAAFHVNIDYHIMMRHLKPKLLGVTEIANIR